MKLREIAYARSGDKGSNANIGLIAYRASDYPIIQKLVTEDKVQQYFQHLGVTKTVRYELPNLWALNFVLYNVLSGGGSRSLRIDAQGKALGQLLLDMSINED